LAKAAKLPLNANSYALAKRMLRDHISRHLGRLFAAFACMAIAAAATAGLAKVMEAVLDDIFIRQDRTMLLLVGAAILVSFVAKGLGTFGQGVLMNWIGFRIIADFQIQMFAHLMRADLQFFHDNHAGTLVTRFINDVQVLRLAVADTFTGIGKDALTLVFLLGVMFYQDWVLACIAFLVFPVAILPIIKIGRRMRKVSTNTQVEIGQFGALLDEAFQGARHVKAYGMEDYETGRATNAINRIFKLIYKATRTRALSHPIMEFLGGVAVVSVVLYGGYQVIAGGRTPGQFFSFITALILAYEPMKRLANLNSNLQEGLAAAARIFAMLDSEPSIVNKPGAATLKVSAGAIAFQDVTFAYVPGKRALTNLTLEVPAGKTVALVGPSGAGKSSVLNLIPRFYDADSGHVAIDGQDVRDVTLASLHGAIGVVAQDTALFNESIAYNIGYGRADAARADMVEAARAAQVHEFILSLPQGYDTVVGERGLKLSGGEKQRIAIARAILRRPPILVFDEATANLDRDTAEALARTVNGLRGRATVLFIAHHVPEGLRADAVTRIEPATRPVSRAAAAGA